MVKRLLIKVLSKKLKLTIAEACWLLKVYSAEHVEFCTKSSSGTIYATTANSIRQGWNWIKENDPARNMSVRFLGGPASEKGNRKYYNGTFVTFVIDRVLYAYQIHGLSYNWLLKFNAGLVKPIWEQLETTVPAKLLRFATPPKARLETLKQLTFF